MDYIEVSLKIISIFANLVVIAAGIAAIYYVLDLMFLKHRKRQALERYLLAQRESSLNPEDHGMRTVLHLMAKLKLTEAEVYDAAFSSPNVVCPDIGPLDGGRGTEVAFQYVMRSNPPFPVRMNRVSPISLRSH